MRPSTETAQAFLDRWAEATLARDAERASDLFLRDPPAVVTFSDGARSLDWLDTRVRLQRDLSRVAMERVEVHDVLASEPADGVLVVTFDYDMHVRDMWGTPSVAQRHATFTLVHTKDGLRIAAAHFSGP
jgi:hypothetical protein